MRRVLDTVAVGLAVVVLMAFLLGASYGLAVTFVRVMDQIADAVTSPQNSSGQRVPTPAEQVYVA